MPFQRKKLRRKGDTSGGTPPGTAALLMWTQEGQVSDLSDGINEAVIWQWAGNLDLLPAGRLLCDVSFWAQVDSDSSTIRVRLGGTRSLTDGTSVVAQAVSSVGAYTLYNAQASFTNPGGQIPVKVTCLGAAQAFVTTLIQGLSLVILP